MVTMVTIKIMEHINHSQLIDKLGGTGAVARIFKVSSQAVSKMRKNGIPQYRIDYLKLLRPELFENKDINSEKAA